MSKLRLLPLLLAIASSSAACTDARALEEGVWPGGLRVAGERPAAANELDRWIEGRGAALAARTIELAVPGEAAPRKATLAELGVSVDVARSAAHARALLPRTPLDRAREVLRPRIVADVPLVVTVDDAKLGAFLAPLKDETDEPPVAARLDLAHHARVPHRSGRYLDVDEARERVLAAAQGGSGRVELPYVEVPPRVSDDWLAKLDIGTVISRFETHFSRGGDQATRARNIDRAAERLDGVVLMPAEVVSFNDIVGPRTVENGFSKGWEIFKGELVEGIGGGTCQAASTFHAAVFLAGLDVLERLPHSRPSAYITMGLDATVVYPSVDLKVRNPFAFPIVVHAAAAADTVTVELLGHEKPAKVAFGRDVVDTKPFARKVDELPGLAADKVVRKQHGIRGYTVKRTRTVTLPDGTARTEANIDVYPPTTEIYLVAPGADAEQLLPPLADAPPGAGPAAAAAPTSTAATVPASACQGQCAPAPAPTIVEAPGTHRPTAEQAHAPAHLWIRPEP